MVWVILGAVVVAAITYVAFRATGKEPLRGPEADERGDDRERMI